MQAKRFGWDCGWVVGNLWVYEDITSVDVSKSRFVSEIADTWTHTT